MENSQELIGVLQAISVVAKKLAEKLMRIDREIKDYTDFCFTVQIGNKSLNNRRKFEDFLNQITSLQCIPRYRKLT